MSSETSLGCNCLHFDRLFSTEYSSNLLFTFDRVEVQHPDIFASAGLFVGFEQIGFPIRVSDCGIANDSRFMPDVCCRF